MTEGGFERPTSLGRKETHRALEDLNHPIDLLHRVVKIKTRARRARYLKATHQRLVAMMPAAQGQPILIRVRGQIVRMRCVHDKPNERGPFFLWTEDTQSRGNSLRRSAA